LRERGTASDAALDERDLRLLDFFGTFFGFFQSSSSEPLDERDLRCFDFLALLLRSGLLDRLNSRVFPEWRWPRSFGLLDLLDLPPSSHFDARLGVDDLGGPEEGDRPLL
jgi:hypothetical protein